METDDDLDSLASRTGDLHRDALILRRESDGDRARLAGDLADIAGDVMEEIDAIDRLLREMELVRRRLDAEEEREAHQ